MTKKGARVMICLDLKGGREGGLLPQFKVVIGHLPDEEGLLISSLFIFAG